MSRQLDALRNLTQVKLPVFSENFDGLKPEYAPPWLAQIFTCFASFPLLLPHISEHGILV